MTLAASIGATCKGYPSGKEGACPQSVMVDTSAGCCKGSLRSDLAAFTKQRAPKELGSIKADALGVDRHN